MAHTQASSSTPSTSFSSSVIPSRQPHEDTPTPPPADRKRRRTDAPIDLAPLFRRPTAPAPKRISHTDEPLLLPPGSFIIEDFITEAEESMLIGNIDAQPWDNTLQRRTQHYGYKYDYKLRVIDRSNYLGPLPEWMTVVMDRMVAMGVENSRPEQAIVNEYVPGQGISAHLDSSVFGDTVASLSLMSACVMTFRTIHNAATARDAVTFDVLLRPRSLIVLSGDSRYKYTHEIAARKSDMWKGRRSYRTRRCSITYRYLANACR